jgi:putative membrane protein
MMAGMGGMMLGMLLFWLVIIVLAVLLIKALFSTGSSTMKPPKNESSNPLDMLELRYGRGEITREQFLQMKKDMGIQE